MVFMGEGYDNNQIKFVGVGENGLYMIGRELSILMEIVILLLLSDDKFFLSPHLPYMNRFSF